MKAIKFLSLLLFTTNIIIAQNIVIDTGASIEVGTGADICAGIYGNITGNLFGGGTQCNQSMISTFQLSVDVTDGWNMVSVPGINTPNQNVNTWWTFRDPAANVFRFVGNYQSVTDVTAGVGYWMKHSGERTYNTGDEWPAGGIQIVTHNPLTAASGWNLIGGYELSVQTSNITTVPPGLQSGSVYKYSGNYQIATTLDPGYGYWIKLNGAGQIIIPETLTKETQQVEWVRNDWGRIIFIDNSGKSYVLFAVDDKVDLNLYELPPVPPPGIFDIRFSSGRIAEDLNTSSQMIDLNGVEYPLTVRVENMDISLEDETGRAIDVKLKSGENIIISETTINKLIVSIDQIPEEYALDQNYPNPFNPSTTIRFSLPQATQIKINLYNMLGELVATLAEGTYEAGYHKVTFNAGSAAGGLTSGTYVYRLESNSFVQVKKLLLLK